MQRVPLGSVYFSPGWHNFWHVLSTQDAVWTLNKWDKNHLRNIFIILELSTHFVFVCIVNEETREKPKIQKESSKRIAMLKRKGQTKFYKGAFNIWSKI